jgi:iron complex transport system permease protein
MKPFDLRTLATMLLLCVAAAAATGAACLLVGSTGFGWPHGDTFRFRAESVMDAALIGAALAAAGVAYQAVLRNPLADPYLLGASSGAMLAAYIWRLPIFAVSVLGLAALSQQAFAFAGAILAVLLALGLSSRRGRLEPITLLLVGVIINAVNGSIFLLINQLVRGLPDVGDPMAFLVGGIHPIAISQRLSALALIALGCAILFYFGGQLNVASLEDAEAHALGARLNRLRWITLAAASLVTAAAVAISGPIGFVGLICPHLCRKIFGSDQRRLLPTAAAAGAILLMLADAASRYLATENRLGAELPVGVLTGLVGGPFFLALLFGARHRSE